MVMVVLVNIVNIQVVVVMLVVFIIIDSISYFETQPRIGAMDIVMPFLQSMVDVTVNGDKGVVFKFLVTA